MSVAERREAVVEVCDLCGSASPVEIARRGRFDIPLRNVVCTRCGLVYVSPRPSAAELSSFYRLEHESSGLYFGQAFTPAQLATSGRKPAAARMAYLDETASPRQGARALEIGCGAGPFLEQLVARGWDAEGVEPVERLARHAAATTGSRVQACTLEEAVFTGTFDLVAMFHVLEHFHSPSAALVRCRELLSEGGCLYLEVPDLFRPNRARMEDFFQSAHITTFSARTLRRMLLKCGFAPHRVENVGGFLRAVAFPSAEARLERSDAGLDWQEVVSFVQRRRRYYLLPAYWRERAFDAALSLRSRLRAAGAGGAQ